TAMPVQHSPPERPRLLCTASTWHTSPEFVRFEPQTLNLPDLSTIGPIKTALPSPDLIFFCHFPPKNRMSSPNPPYRTRPIAPSAVFPPRPLRFVILFLSVEELLE